MSETGSRHGGDIYFGAAPDGGVWLDFSSNVSPLGMPSEVLAALAATAPNWDVYPDPECRELRVALAKRRNIPAERIVCGNGASDLIFRLCQAAREQRPDGTVLVSAPAFAEYEAAARQAGLAVTRRRLRPAMFSLNETFLRSINGNTSLVFLCNPANPTGVLTPRAMLRQVLLKCEQVGALLVVDECFLGITDAPEAYSMVPLLAAHPALVVLDAFTKVYAMAGLRLGYLMAGFQGVADGVAAAGQPWAVSSPAQTAGLAALRSDEYVAELRGLIAVERPRLAAGLKLLGFDVLPGAANYLCFRVPGGTAELVAALRARGILIRSCADYVGLGSSYYRIAVRTTADNDRLLEALAEVTRR